CSTCLLVSVSGICWKTPSFQTRATKTSIVCTSKTRYSKSLIEYTSTTAKVGSSRSKSHQQTRLRSNYYTKCIATFKSSTTKERRGVLLDFFRVKVRETKDKEKKYEVYPNFIVGRSQHLMVRGGAFYVIGTHETLLL